MVAAPLIAVLALAVAGCGQRAPDRDWTGIHSALRRATQELARRDRELERLIAAAEAATAAARAAPFWRRDLVDESAAWLRAAESARDGLRRMRSEEAAERVQLASLVEAATGELRTAEARMGLAGVTGRQAAKLSAARFQLESAVRLGETGQLSDAIAAAERSLELTAELDEAWERQHERFSDPGLRALWRSQVAETIAASRRSGSAAIVVDKRRRTLLLYRAGREEMVISAELGVNGLTRKSHAGDRATPEGRYRIVAKKGPGATKYHLALLLDYPNEEDRRRYRQAVRAGDVPSGVGIGNLIEIHGEGGTGRDWTDGCVALSNADMDRLYTRVVVGTPVVIVGSR
jgi:hypothetical protein